MARQAEVSTGTLSSWNDERGFGFIVSGDETRRVFTAAHQRMETAHIGKIRLRVVG